MRIIFMSYCTGRIHNAMFSIKWGEVLPIGTFKKGSNGQRTLVIFSGLDFGCPYFNFSFKFANCKLVVCIFSYKFYKLEYRCKGFHFFGLDALAGNEFQKSDSTPVSYCLQLFILKYITEKAYSFYSCCLLIALVVH